MIRLTLALLFASALAACDTAAVDGPMPSVPTGEVAPQVAPVT